MLWYVCYGITRQMEYNRFVGMLPPRAAQLLYFMKLCAIVSRASALTAVTPTTVRPSLVYSLKAFCLFFLNRIFLGNDRPAVRHHRTLSVRVPPTGRLHILTKGCF